MARTSQWELALEEERVMRRKTTNLLSRAFATLMAIMLLLGLVPSAAFAAPGAGEGAGNSNGGGAGGTITVYLDFEGYNLGQGFYLEPTAVEVPVGATAGQAMELLLKQTNHRFEGGVADNYLIAVEGFDKGSNMVSIPAYITDQGGPTTQAARETGNEDAFLGQGDYSAMSNWAYTVNHEMANLGIGEQILEDGDVLRFQFAVWGYGCDLGIPFEWGIPYYSHADKTELIRALFTDAVSEDAKQDALALIIDPLATEKAVSDALVALATPEVPGTPEPPVPSVDKTALEAAIVEAEALTETDYTADSWTVLFVALGEAKAVVTAATTTQDEIDTAQEALQNAIAGLTASAGQSGQSGQLSDLAFSRGLEGYRPTKLTPAFLPDVHSYTITLPDYTSRFYAYADVAVKGEGIQARVPSEFAGSYNLLSVSPGFWNSYDLRNAGSGYNYSFTVTNTIAQNPLPYTVAVTIQDSLKALEIDGAVSPSFAPDIFDYTVGVAEDATSVSVTATAFKSTYALSVNDAEATSGVPLSVAPDWDENGRMKLSILVSNSGDVPTTYTVTLIRETRGTAPLITVQPQGADYLDIAAAITPLTLRAVANGTLSYQWYRSTSADTEGATPIADAIEASYTPPVAFVENPETTYYHCVVTNTTAGQDYATVSNPAAVTVKPNPALTVTLSEEDDSPIPEEGYSYNTGDTVVKTVKANVASRVSHGVLRYQWYEKTAYGNTTLQGVTNQQTYTPPTTRNGALDVYCKVTYICDGVDYVADTKTFSLKITAVFALPPSITTQPLSAEYMVDTPASVITALSVRASSNDGGALSYQWYSNTSADREGATAVSGATRNSFTPPTSVTSDAVYYFCRVTNTVKSLNGESYTAYEDSDFACLRFNTLEDLDFYLPGLGTTDSPYLIASLDDLEFVRDLVNVRGVSFKDSHFKMTADVTLPADWTPIGALKPGMTSESSGRNVNPFSGSLNGDGHTVTIPVDGLPLFGYVREASVKNLNIFGERIAGYGLVNNYTVDYGADGSSGTGIPATIVIEDVTLKSGSQTLRAGFIGGYASGSNIITIRNSTVEQGVVIGYDGSQSAIGSFAGSFNGTMENCVSFAEVRGVNNVGGLIGNKGQSMGTCLVRDSAFEGSVIATGTYVGGLVGAGYGSASAPNTPCVSIQNSYVTGSVTGFDCVGGIFGGEPACTQNWVNGIGFIENNYFIGTVIGGEGSQNVGGIIGLMKSLDRYNVIANNFYLNSCGASRGIGSVGAIDTNATTRYNRDDDPLGEDAGRLAQPMAATQFADGSVTALLNAGANGSGDWVQGATAPTFGGTRHIVSLTVSGIASRFAGGAPFDASGLSALVRYSDGTVGQIDADDVVISGFDSSTQRYLALKAEYENVYNLYEVYITSNAPTPSVDKTALEAAIAEVEALAEADYTADSWTVLFVALGEAKAVVTAATTTQDEIDAAREALDTAREALEKKATAPEPNSAHVYFIVERSTIGQGLFVEPIKVSITPGETTVYDLLARAVGEERLILSNGNNYLQGIRGADERFVAIPEYIALLDGDTKNGPVTADALQYGQNGDYDADALVEQDYRSLSGWMFFVNNTIGSRGVSEQVLYDGDVIRFAFSFDSLGADLGSDFGGSIAPAFYDSYQFADFDELIAQTAEAGAILASQTPPQHLDIDNLQKAYLDALALLNNPVANQLAVDWQAALLKALRGGIEQDMPANVTVTFQTDDTGFVLAKQELEVEADISERYGYRDEYEGTRVTALDAMVAAHITLFTDEDLDDWLVVSNNGFVTRVLGENTASMIYLINGAMSGDGNYVDDSFLGGTAQTGYSVSQALLSTDDDLLFYLLRDDYMYGDNIVWFASTDGEAVDRIEVGVDEDLSLTLAGYMNWYGNSDAEWQARYTYPIEDAAIVSVTLDNAAGFTVGTFGNPLAMTDEDGEVTLSFDKPGTYVLSARDDSGYAPMASPWLTVTVTQPLTPTVKLPEASEVAELMDGLARAYSASGVLDNLGFGDEWVILGLARGENLSDEARATYLKNLAALLESNSGVLSSSRYTEYSRVILALTALGVDATDFAGYDLTKPLVQYDKVTSQGINGAVFALIALDTGSYPLAYSTDSANQGSRERYVDFILAREIAGGGFALTGSTPDPDVTAMVLQALLPYQNDTAVATVIDRALIALSSRQSSDGGFISWGAASVESAAQVLVVLSALGIPLDDERFVKNGRTVYDALTSFLVDDKTGFKHDATGGVNGMATQQGSYALVALYRSLVGLTSLYDMSDVTLAKYPADDEEPVSLVYKSVLDVAIASAEALNGSEYSSASWQALRLALDAAKAVALSTSVTQDEVDGILAVLVAAMSALVVAPDDSGLGDGNGNNADGITNNTNTTINNYNSRANTPASASGVNTANTNTGNATTADNSADRGLAGSGNAATGDAAELPGSTSGGDATDLATITDPGTPQASPSASSTQEAALGIVLTPRIIVGLIALIIALILATVLLTRTILYRRWQRERGA
jgi:hypothetical protein